MHTYSKQDTAVGAVIKTQRESLGLSRQALAERAGGVSISTIRRVERSEGKPHQSTISALIHALMPTRVPLDEYEAAGSDRAVGGER
jgi:ribosome-binding protein aMBF1 (putative translation factor)